MKLFRYKEFSLMLEQISTKKITVNEFVDAAEDGNIEVMKDYVSSGGDVNLKDSVGIFALYWAIMQNRPEVVIFLIQSGEDVNQRDKHNRTSLEVAYKTNFAWDNKKEIIKILENPNEYRLKGKLQSNMTKVQKNSSIF